MPVRDKSAVPRVTDIAAVEDFGNDFAILYEGTVFWSRQAQVMCSCAPRENVAS